MIDIAALSVRFGNTEAVKNVTFTVERGESFGLVGESGSGKSTVLRALAGLNTVWTGRMVLADEVLARCIRARPSIGCSASLCWCTGWAISSAASCGRSTKWRCHPPCGSAIRTSYPAASGSVSRSRAR